MLYCECLPAFFKVKFTFKNQNAKGNWPRNVLGAEYILNIYTEIFMDFILIYFMFINYIYIQIFCVHINTQIYYSV